MENFRIECTFLKKSVCIRAIHDVQNGSAIFVEEKTLVKALEKLAKEIRKTNLRRFDKVWGNDRIR